MNRPSPFRRRVMRAIRCKPFTRIQRKKPNEVGWLPSHETYRRLAAIGWYPGKVRAA